MDLSAYDLYMLIHQRNVQFPEALIAYITIAAVEALDFLQQKEVYHRDIKPQNILLNREGEIKLCDFGESKLIKNSIASSYVGTIPYWPPERFKAVQRYSIEADIWSIGITMAELAYGKLPYIDEFGRAINDIIALQRAIKDITSTVIVERCFKQHNYSKNLKDFACLCLSEAESRPKSCELKRATLYQQYQGVVNTSVVKQHLENLLPDDISDRLSVYGSIHSSTGNAANGSLQGISIHDSEFPIIKNTMRGRRRTNFDNQFYGFAAEMFTFLFPTVPKSAAEVIQLICKILTYFIALLIYAFLIFIIIGTGVAAPKRLFGWADDIGVGGGGGGDGGDGGDGGGGDGGGGGGERWRNYNSFLHLRPLRVPIINE